MSLKSVGERWDLDRESYWILKERIRNLNEGGG